MNAGARGRATMRIAIGADHAGFRMKEELVEYLRERGFDVIDMGTHGPEPVDYPDFARAVGKEIQAGRAQRGILICGSGVGTCIAANKMAGIRAGLCHDCYSACQGVEHDDMNVLCLGARVVGLELAKKLVSSFLSARFNGQRRHLVRLRKITAMEKEDKNR